MAGGALDPGPWRTTVQIEAAPAVRDELRSRGERTPPPRSVWVTDLVDPRTAYWRTTSPVATSPERASILAAGRELHHLVETALAAPRFLEVRLVRDGIVGQVDLFEDRPTELKTTSPLPPLEGLPDARPAYFEQLGMYSALVDRSDARLLLVDGSDPAAPAVAVLDCRFAPLSRVHDAMQARAALLRSALDRRDPAALPACPWYDRGCEFRAAGVCTCRGNEPPLDRSIRDTLSELRVRADEAEALGARLVRAFARESDLPVRRFRDLMYPRRAFFERTAPAPEGGAEAAPPPPREGLYPFLADVLESGPAGEVTRVPTVHGEPEESVTCFRGDPMLLRTTRSYSVTTVAELPSASPQYFLDLAFRCAAVERPSGWLILGYERAPTWADRLRVYRVRFDPFAPVMAMARARAEALRRAIRERDAGPLPACPRWMYDSCPYAPGCGCGSPGGRSNR